MSPPERTKGASLRSLGSLAAIVLPFVALATLFVTSERHWAARDRELEREASTLRVKVLGRALESARTELAATADAAARSAAVSNLLEAPPVRSRTPPESLPVDAVDALLVVGADGAVRLDAVELGGRLVAQPPDPRLVGALAGAEGSAVVDGQWFEVRRVPSRVAGAPAAGWVAVGRALATRIAPQLAAEAGAAIGARAWDGALPPHGAVLRDARGAPLAVFELAAAAAGGSTRAVWTSPGLGVALALLGVLAIAVGAGRRFFRSRLSADARYKAIIDQATEGIVAVDPRSYRVLFTNPAFLARLGYSAAEAQSLTLADIFADGDTPADMLLARLRDAEAGSALYLQQRCRDGTLVEAEVRCNALEINGRRLLACTTQDVSLRRKAEQQLLENQQRLDRLAHHDQLTGLPNRHYLAAFLPNAIAAAKAAGSMLGVVFLDLDRFKHINDTRGHETGDKLLQEVSQRLRACVRESDVVVRMGGDEFVFVFRNVKSYDEVTLGASRIIETLNGPIVVDGHALQTSGSVGVSVFPRDGADMVELLKHSDMAMYQAKDRGRNNVQLFTPILNRRLKRRVAVEASLREALRLKQLDVHYQPFVDLLTRKVVGLEALIRWRHPVHGMIPADQFIPVAEETGLVVPLGDFVLRRSLQNMSNWRRAGVTLVPVSLNVASSQLQRGELQATISTLLATHGLGPELLQLEMTERAVFDSGPAQPGERRQDTIARLRDLGIKIAIDDFGTGYSSLSYLKHWRVDALKIDRSFIRDLVTDSSDLAIVSAIVAMARQLRITVIAEGIEGYQQAEILSRLGCTLGQGYLFARPMPADDCLEVLRAKVLGRREDDVEDMLATLATRS